MMKPIWIPATSSPTTTETSALAALVPASTAPTKPTTAALDEALALCQNPDVVSFLFTDDKIQIPYLTSPALMTSAITGTMTSTRVEPDQSCGWNIGQLSAYVSGKWVFIPAFSVSGVSLGFGMHEFNYNPRDAWGGDYTMYIRSEFRFVRNEAKGEMLVVHDIPSMNAYCMEYSRTVTPTCQTRTSLCLYRDKAREAAKNGYLDRTNMSACIEEMTTIYEFRKCPTCHRDHTMCPCTLQLARSRHPFDHATFVKNMTQRLGTFEGVARVFCYDDGIFDWKSAVGSRSTMRGGIDQQLITEMRDWAVDLHVKGTENPLQTITAPAQEESRDITYPSAEETEEIDLSLEQIMEPGSLFLDDNDPFGDLPPLDCVSDDMQGVEDDLLGISGRIDASLIEAMNWKLPKGLQRSLRVKTKGFNERPVQRNEKVQPLLDLTGAATVSSERSNNSPQEDAAHADLEKNLKAEMRRRRNRESAHRSNMKKKAVNDKLKHELKTNKQKADTLRIHESELRQENIRLRRMLAKSAT